MTEEEKQAKIEDKTEKAKEIKPAEQKTAEEEKVEAHKHEEHEHKEQEHEEPEPKHKEHEHEKGKEKSVESKKILEREYVVPLRREWLKVPTYKRANKAVKALKQFIARHMKIYDRDLRKIKIDIHLNNEIRFRGMRYPPAKIKVKATKHEDGNVIVRLVELPKHIEFEIARIARRETEQIEKGKEAEKKETAKAVEKAEKQAKEQTKEEKPSEDKIGAKEKRESSKAATEQLEKQQAKKTKHTAGIKKEPIIQRKALQK